MALAIRDLPVPDSQYKSTPLGDLTLNVLKIYGCPKGSSIISLLNAFYSLYPELLSYPTSSSISSYSLLIGSSLSNNIVFGATMQNSPEGLFL